MDIKFEYLNANDEVEVMDLSSGGYTVEEWTPHMVRVWGTYEKQIDVTILVPLERVLSLSLIHA